ncbi:MAG TPA: hypothetical protein VK709_11050 [Candidatus Saccharimonadales bacterium]|jgi:hypothetical protein|nr:hypothetical protein [Candidatus Saccharimonadales bacterium]
MHLLDSVLAFAAIMLVASLVITAGTQLTISLLGLRGTNLQRSLADLFETASDDKDAKRYSKVIAGRALRHPFLSGSVFSRFGIRIEELPFVPADAAGKLRWAGNGIPFQPWLLGALSGFFIWPAALAAIQRLTSLDISTFSSIVASYIPFLSFYDHPWRTGAIAGAIFGGLLSRWRLATCVRADELVAVLEKLSSPPGGSLPDPAQRAMLVIAGEAQSGPRSKTNSTAAEYEKFVRELPENEADELGAVLEKASKQTSEPTEPKMAGLDSWFDHAMDRASQRFTLQARVITVTLSILLVFGAHLDAIRLFRAVSSDAGMRTQLTASADALQKQTGQISKAHEEGTGVPDIYRKAMVDVLQSAPIATDQTKSKPHHSSHHAVTTAPGGSQTIAADGSAELPENIQAASQASADAASGQSSEPPSPQAPVKGSGHKSSKSSKTKTALAADVQKPPATPGEDRVTLEAKARASKELEKTPGFASREDAVAWLRATLNADPAAENLVMNYEQAVNTQLVSDTDKLLDHSASLKHDLAHSELQLVPETWPGWKPTGNELPGFLLALALLSLGAPLCYNMLKTVASLRPMQLASTKIFVDRRIRREDRRQPQAREQARPQPRPQVSAQEKPKEERLPAGTGRYGSLL